MEDLIHTEEENAVALRLMERLMGHDPAADSPEGMLLRGLAYEIKKFEDKNYGK